jgi:P2 family phage contractile tail tube protein
MSVRDVIKNFNLFVDGRGYAGQVEEFNPPKLTTKDEEFRGGGMDGSVEIEMGIEKLEADFSMLAFDRAVLSLWGVAVGKVVPFVLRAALQSEDGTVTAIAHTMRGRVKALEPGALKAGDKSSLKVSLALSYYKLDHGGTTVTEIDVENMVRMVGGTDVLAAQRAALGI